MCEGSVNGSYMWGINPQEERAVTTICFHSKYEFVCAYLEKCLGTVSNNSWTLILVMKDYKQVVKSRFSKLENLHKNTYSRMHKLLEVMKPKLSQKILNKLLDVSFISITES